MSTRAAVAVCAAGLTAIAAPAAAQGVAIDHRTVGCIVAGKFPRLNARFAPASRLAWARVYFRVAEGPSDWYYVDMRSDAPCFAGVLPRPRRELVGRRLQHYVDAFDQAFVESRTAEAEARVVAAPGECDPKRPVAPLLDSARVAVFPGMPTGFSGGAAGLGGATLAVVVGSGAALAGGGIAVAARGSSGGTGGGEPPVTSPPETLPPTTSTTTSTTTTLPAPGFAPVFKVLKGAALQLGDTVSDPEPLTLVFRLRGRPGERIAFSFIAEP